MSYLSEFPDYDGTLYCPKDWIDASYHNDTCPHIMRRIETETMEIECNVWQDYVNKELRENDYGARYLFQIKINGFVAYSLETDDLEEVKHLMKGVTI